MKPSCLAILIVTTEAFCPTTTTTTTTTTTNRSATSLHNSISGPEKRANRPPIAPLTPNTGIIGSYAGPKRLPPSPHPSERSPTPLTTKSTDESSLKNEIRKLQQNLKERNDDVDTLIFEVYRLRTSNEQVRSTNEARSNDFNVLKQEAQKLKLEFEQRNKENEERVRALNDRLGEERSRYNEERERFENMMRDKDERITRLLQKTKEDALRIEDLEYRLRNEVALASPSLSDNGFINRVSAQQYRQTKSYNERRDAAMVGGLPISYRPRSLTQNGQRQSRSLTQNGQRQSRSLTQNGQRQSRVSRGEGGTEPGTRGDSTLQNNDAMINSWDQLFTARDAEQGRSDYDSTMLNGSGELWQN